MRKLAAFSGLLLLLVLPAMAQDTTPAPAPEPGPKASTSRYTPKVEVSAGYMHRPYYESSGATIPMNGWYGSADYNVKSWIGAEAQILGVYGDEGAGVKVNIYNLMVGPRIYPLRHRSLTPFGHVLYGGGRYNLSIPSAGGFPAATVINYSSTWEVGGGVEMNIRKHWGIQVEANYGKTNFFSGNANKGSIMYSGGLSYHFGGK